MQLPPPSFDEDDAAAAVEAPQASWSRVAGWLRRPVVAGLLLLVVYAGLSFALNDPRGTLGTDTGGKLATLHMMERNGGLDPDIGYWAQQYDRTGILHPLHYTYLIGGKWMNVTTVPMLYAAYPLYRIGGDRAVLLLPMLGAVLCAFAARALARRLGGGDGWSTFWIVGLATPVTIYALDFWEHTLGLGLMLWGVILLLDVLERRAGWRGALAAGVLFGVAATMRTEALVYLVVAVGITCLVALWRDRSLVRPITTGIAAVAGVGIPLLADRALEQVTIGTYLRGARVAGTAAGAGTSMSERIHEAFTTAIGLGLNGLRPSGEWVVGIVTVGLVALGAWGLASTDRRRVALESGSVRGGVRRVPDAALARSGVRARDAHRIAVRRGGVPLGVASRATAAPGRHRGRRAPDRVVRAVLGWCRPAMGGRYILLSGTVLAVAGCVALEGRTRALVAVLALAAVTTGAGLTWLSVRSHTVAEGMTAIVERHDQLVISRQSHMLREGGAFYDSREHWLTATTKSQLRDALGIARESGATEFGLIDGIDDPPPATLGPYERGRTQRVAFIRPDVFLGVTTYRLG